MKEPNIRLRALDPGYLYGVKDNNIYVNLFAGNISTIKVNGKDVVLEETTECRRRAAHH